MQLEQISAQLQSIKNKIAEYEQKYNRIKNSVQLLAVSKGQSIEKIQAAYLVGQRLFAENYVQEALAKQQSLKIPETDPIEWHFIGHIQRNKTKHIAENFAWVHGIDNKIIAQRLNDQRPAHLGPLNACIQINISHEASKFGVDAQQTQTLLEECTHLPHLKIRGLMVIPAKSATFDKQRAIFHEAFMLWQTLRDSGFSLDTLSMGMSEDFEAAIAEGATIVRLGTGIFGKR